MAGLPRSFDAAKVELGPGDLWIGTAVPASGAIVTVIAAADGALTPDATENPTALHLGYTAAGTKVSYKPNLQTFEPDESTAPIITAIIGEPSGVAGDWWQLLDMSKALTMMAGGTAFTPTGYTGVKWGGKQALTTYPIVLIAPLYADPTKVLVVQLYKAYNTAGLDFGVTRKAPSASPFAFNALTVATRAAGDQIGYIAVKS